MAAITVESYQNIANYYTAAQRQLIGVSDYYYHAAEEIVMLQDFDPELDLLAPFYSAYSASLAAYSTPPPAIVSAVSSLQKHVLARATTTAGVAFTNINQWIDANGDNGYLTAPGVGRANDIDTAFTVYHEFATLSLQAGFEIDADNIHHS